MLNIFYMFNNFSRRFLINKFNPSQTRRLGYNVPLNDIAVITLRKKNYRAYVDYI